MGLSAEHCNMYIIFKHVVMLIKVRDIFGTELEDKLYSQLQGVYNYENLHPLTTLSAFNT